jgi:hypothetical protein
MKCVPIDEKMDVHSLSFFMTIEMARLSERIAYALHLSCVTAHQTGFSNLLKNIFFSKLN